MTSLHDQFPDTDDLLHGVLGQPVADPANTFSDTLKWHARNRSSARRNWAETVINWNLALDPPAARTWAAAPPAPASSPSAPATPYQNAEYYALGHLGPVRQAGGGAHRQHPFGTTGWNGQVMDVASQPGGSTVLVAHNENDNSQHVRGPEGGRRSPTPCGRRWPPSPAAAPYPARTRCVRSARRAGARPRARPAPPTRAAPATWTANAADGDASTRYSTGAARPPASTCRSTSAGPSPPGRSSSTPGCPPATTRAATRSRPALTT